MEHLDNIALIIFLRLLFNTEPLELVVKDRSMESQNELLNYVYAINSYINCRKDGVKYKPKRIKKYAQVC